VRMPIAHAEGNFVHDDATLDTLESAGRVVFRYAPPPGRDEDETVWNVNGSRRAIAGLSNDEGNVLGLMPHPERCSEALLGNTDGLALFAAAVGIDLLGADV